VVVLANGKEYCQFESLNATCPATEVILIDEARYGRLQLGRCASFISSFTLLMTYGTEYYAVNHVIYSVGHENVPRLFLTIALVFLVRFLILFLYFWKQE